MAKKKEMESNPIVRLGNNSGAELLKYIERIENIREEKKTLAEDEREVFAELKANGWDVRQTREMLNLRKLDASVREERETLRGIYAKAIKLSGVADLV